MGDKEKLWAHKNNGVVKSKLSNTATCISFDRFIFCEDSGSLYPCSKCFCTVMTDIGLFRGCGFILEYFVWCVMWPTFKELIKALECRHYLIDGHMWFSSEILS